jgi:CheY-like chemotaxis protein
MSSAKYKIAMLVDDNEIDNFTNKRLLETYNFAEHIIVTGGGKSGIEFLSTCKDEELPNIILLDIMMPIMDGFQFLEEFSKQRDAVKKACKIVMLSTSESFKDLNRANKSPYVYKFLNKPLSEQMLAAINV